MNVEEYLQLDDASLDVRYEYLDGQITAMAGGTAAHSTLKINMILALRRLFSRGACRTFDSDMRVQLSETRYVYPDASVTCEHVDIEDENVTLRSPLLVVEVLSPGTEMRDRTKKLAAYQEVPTIQEYVLVNYSYQCVELYRREGQRCYYRFVPDQEVELTSLDIRIPVTDIYSLTNIPVHDTWENDAEKQ